MGDGSKVRMSPEEAKWRAEADHRTLTEAAEIQADRRRMSGVSAHHRKVAKAHNVLSRTLLKGRR